MRARRSVVAALAAATAVLLAAVALNLAAVRSLAWDLLPPAWRIGISAFRHGVTVDHDIVITMPDGVRLAASLYRPRAAAGPLPAVLIRMPYRRLHYGEGYGLGIPLAGRGYAVLVQDLRGTGDSGGALLPWRDAGTDGSATLDWIVAQPWSSGKVGTIGCSALGETQFPLARLNHPAHAAMIASGAGGAAGSVAGRYAYFGVFEGGVFQLASGFGWFARRPSADAPGPPPAPNAELLRQLPVASLIERVGAPPSGYAEFLDTPLADPLWHAWGYLSDADRSRVPALVINTWGDQTVGDTLALAERWRRDGLPQRVVIAPGNHCDHTAAGRPGYRFGELELRNAGRPWLQWYLQWFDHWLRGEGSGLAGLAPYTYFMLIENSWRSSDAWPPREARAQRWHLGGAGHANTRAGDGVLSPEAGERAAVDEFRYDPADPVPTVGGPVCCTGDPAAVPGPVDQRSVEQRADVLVYTSAPLPEDLRIAGPLSAELSVSTDVPDTDIVARLVHVWPDGRATNIQEGALRLRYRNGFARPEFLQPGTRYTVRIDMRSIAYLVPRGHRLRLQLTGSSFPRLERNLNTGAANNARETAMAVAHTRVHHGADARSFVQLAVLPDEPGEPDD